MLEELANWDGSTAALGQDLVLGKPLHTTILTFGFHASSQAIHENSLPLEAPAQHQQQSPES